MQNSFRKLFSSQRSQNVAVAVAVIATMLYYVILYAFMHEDVSSAFMDCIILVSALGLYFKAGDGSSLIEHIIMVLVMGFTGVKFASSASVFMAGSTSAMAIAACVMLMVAVVIYMFIHLYRSNQGEDKILSAAVILNHIAIILSVVFIILCYACYLPCCDGVMSVVGMLLGIVSNSAIVLLIALLENRLSTFGSR